MTGVVIVVVVVVAVLVALGAARWRDRLGRAARPRPAGSRRILFPFVTEALSADALDCALRLASAEQAVLVAVCLARVSMSVPLRAALPRQGSVGLRLLEAIEQRASRFGVGVDARVARGRSYRHALREAIASESFDRIVIAAAPASGPGVGAEDVRWLLDKAPGEIVVLRPDAAGSYITPGGSVRAPAPATSLASVG
jgi:nucleotide-binding universal stress UspA family protein